jgi:hypothetical protein
MTPMRMLLLLSGGSAFSPLSLYAGSAKGLWYGTGLTDGFQVSDGTVALTAPGQGTADCVEGYITDKSGNGLTGLQATAAARPTLSARRNLLLATALLSTQSVTTVATPYTLQFTGSGTVTLSGTSTAGPLVGGGTLTFTPTAGTLTLTVSGSVTVAQLELGSTATTYQAITDASNYNTSPATSFPRFFKLDGVDDGFATAAFAAGTFSSDMTFMCAIRRTSAASGLLFSEIVGVTPYLAIFTTADGNPCSSGAGTPTYFANGVAVPGGTGTTRGQLATALPVGQWVILEIRNADLSLWVRFAISQYVGGIKVDGSLGEILLCETPSAAVLTQMRQYLAAQYGVTVS